MFVISYTDPLFLIVVAVLSVTYAFLQRVYVASSRQLRRLESVARSPVYSLFGETLSGVATIRAYNRDDDFKAELESKSDGRLRAELPLFFINRWGNIRLELLSLLVQFFAAFFAVLGRDALDPGLVGLSLTYATQITLTLNIITRRMAMVINNT